MKFIALVSGGKDSCFNIIQCLNAGHELVAMANLHPRQDRPEEIDSWMFQTVGHQVVKYLAECAQVPLFKAEISEDEEEVVHELAGLFNSIKANGVEFEGVSVGAIGSTYQQVRVDKACELLNLRTLSYLWQRDQSELLHEIVVSGLDARIIKVAGMGLDQRHLGKSLAEVEHELISMHDDFGLHPCGEGGEYETMVFDAPFFKANKLEIIAGSQKTVQHSTDDVYYLEFEVELASRSASEPRPITPRPLLAPEFAQLTQNPVLLPVTHAKPAADKSQIFNASLAPAQSQRTVQGTFAKVFNQLSQLFATELNIESCYHVEVVIQAMDRFAQMNILYNEVFKASARSLSNVPPSRACIESAIPWEVEITIFVNNEIDRSGKGIHVQGLSYWAPASIGPYSQCRLTHGISYVAGQIGLIPQTLTLAEPIDSEPTLQALLALQNAARILDVMHEKRSNWETLIAIVYITQAEDREIAESIWTKFSTTPLIVVQISELPRRANFEWILQACDLRFFSWFVPDSDEHEEFYSSKPEVLEYSSTKFTKRAGFQVRRVSCEPLPDAQFVFSTSKTAPTSLQTHWVPASALYYNSIRVNEIFISSS